MGAEHKTKRFVGVPGVAIANGAVLTHLVDLLDVGPVFIIVERFGIA